MGENTDYSNVPVGYKKAYMDDSSPLTKTKIELNLAEGNHNNLLSVMTFRNMY